MKIGNECKAQWLMRGKVADDWKMVAIVQREEERTNDNGKYSVLSLSNADGDYLVSSWALITEKGVKELNTEKGMHVQIYCKPGNKTKFFIKNIEEELN